MMKSLDANFKRWCLCLWASLFVASSGQQIDDGVQRGNAAYRVWLEKQDKDYASAFSSLVSAAQLGHSESCYLVAFVKWPKDFDYSSFGLNKDLAKISLMEHAPKSDSRTWYQIGIIYGNLAKEDKNYTLKARECYKISAYGMCIDSWMDYADSCYKGEFDVEEAYLFYSAATYVYRPDTFIGDRAWQMRREISKKLGADKCMRLLKKLDALFKEKGFPGLALPSPALDSSDENFIHDSINQVNKLQADDRNELQRSIEMQNSNDKR